MKFWLTVLLVVIYLHSSPWSLAQNIRFWVDSSSLEAGDCTYVRWDVSEVREVYFEGGGVTGQESRQVCPSSTRTYNLRVVFRDGREQVYRVTITVNGGVAPTLTPPPATPAPTATPRSWFPEFPSLPTFPKPSEILAEILGTIFQPVLDTITGWLAQLSQLPILFEQHFSVDGDGFLGNLGREGFAFTLGLAVPFISLSLLSSCFQTLISGVFPNLLNHLTISQAFGRTLIIVFVLSLGPDMLGQTSATMDIFVWSVIAETHSRWGWVELFINTLSTVLIGGNVAFLILWSVLILFLFALLFLVTIINNIIFLLVYILLPLAALAWLFVFTEGWWREYWWLVLKMMLYPVFLAILLRINLMLLGLYTGGNIFFSTLALMIVSGVGAWLLLKFALMSLPAATTTVAFGVGVAAGGLRGGLEAIGYLKKKKEQSGEEW